MNIPLISCIMPTFNRRRFVPAAIEHFRRQDWLHKELIVVDDGSDSVRDLVPDDPHITFLRLEQRTTIGRKRNIACDRARGELVAHWDDDDWHAPSRLRLQAEALLASQADLCGIARLLFCNPHEGRAWEYVYNDRIQPLVGGSTLFYRRSLWAQTPFPELDIGEDVRFLMSAGRRRIMFMSETRFHVGRVHAGNVAPKFTQAPPWRPLPLEEIRAVIGDDWPLFCDPSSIPARATEPGALLASCIMPTANRREFVALALEHFARQDYAPAELIVVDSGNDAVDDLCARAPRVRYIRARTGASIGTQRNLACLEAKGDVVIHWDDDDWFGPGRLRRQIEPIASGRADVTGLESRYVWNLSDTSFWTMNDDLHKRMFVGNVHGGTLAYRRSLLGNGLRYDDINLAEDARLLTGMLRSGARLERVANDGVFVYVRHGRNAWRFDTGTFLGSAGWSRTDPPATLSRDTIERYRALDATLPAAHARAQPAGEQTYIDCLGGTEIEKPWAPMRLERCIALVATDPYADFLEGALTSLALFGAVPDVPRVVFVATSAPRCQAIAARHGARVVRCRSLRASGPSIKGAMYSMARAVEAKQYLCLDADVLVLDNLAPLFEMHAKLPRGHVLIGPEATKSPMADLREGLQAIYLATALEADQLLEAVPGAAGETNVVNDGVFVADIDALAGIDDTIRSTPTITRWVSARRDVWWRQKAALNLALARTRTIVPLDSAYNAQLHLEAAVRGTVNGQVNVQWRGAPPKVLHFNGHGKNAYAMWRRTLLAGIV